MTERVNLVDAYDNRSVIAKMVNMEERISGAENSVEASAEAAASSASAAAASQTAAKTSETNAKASADTAAATLSNTVDLSSKQTVTGAKTFAGDTTVTGSFVTSGNAEMSKLDIDTGKLTVGSGGSAEINGPLTATNPANVLQAANHDTVLTSNDVLTAKDINEVNGSANNLLHRNASETLKGQLNEVNSTGVKVISSSQNYNNLYLLNRGRYSTVVFGNTTDDKSVKYKIGDVGISYATANQSSVRVQSYAQPTDASGSNPPIKCGLIISVNSSANTASLVVQCQVWDSTSTKYVTKDKVIATFSNGAWD